MINIDENALKACRENNKEKTANETAEPEVGGNTQKYKQLLGSQAKFGDAEEFTYTNWPQSALELVLLNLLQEYEKFVNPPEADPSTGTIPKPQKPAILDQNTLRMGVSFSAHKKTQNIVQLLFIKQASNLIE